MRRVLVAALLVAPLLLGGVLDSNPRPAYAKDAGRLDKAASKQKSKIAKVWLDLVRHLVGRDLKAEAAEFLEQARALDPTHDDLEELAARVEALEGAGTSDASTVSRIEKAKKGVAKGYDKLAGIFAKEKNDPRFALYLVEAMQLEASKSRLKKLSDVAKKDFLLLRAPGHPAVAYVSFPKGWKAGKEYPVLVSVDGAGANFLGNARAFKNNRGSRPFITVAPHALSCTNEINKAKFPAYSQALIDEWNAKRADFDVPGLVAILDFLREHFGAEEKIAITGFSGGGNLCYSMIFLHPERVFCAAPACANFNPGIPRNAKAVEDGGPQVHVLTGAKDKHRDFTHGNKDSPGIEPQTDWAMEAFEKLGFTNVKRTMLDGVGHSNCARQVWEYVDEVLTK